MTLVPLEPPNIRSVWKRSAESPTLRSVALGCVRALCRPAEKFIILRSPWASETGGAEEGALEGRATPLRGWGTQPGGELDVSTTQISSALTPTTRS